MESRRRRTSDAVFLPAHRRDDHEVNPALLRSEKRRHRPNGGAIAPPSLRSGAAGRCHSCCIPGVGVAPHGAHGSPRLRASAAARDAPRSGARKRATISRRLASLATKPCARRARRPELSRFSTTIRTLELCGAGVSPARWVFQRRPPAAAGCVLPWCCAPEYSAVYSCRAPRGCPP